MVISNCQKCKSRATWHDLEKIEKGKLNLACDAHVPPESERKGRKWTYNKYGWTPVSFFGYNK